MTSKELGAKIKERRKALGLTQPQLALLAGCSRPSVTAAETGKSTLQIQILLNILAVLGFKIDLGEINARR